MRKLTASFAALAMLLWVLPLGNFIKPSQEKSACGGGRAFHMCSMMSKARPVSDTGKIAFTNASSVEKTAKSSASAGNDLLPLDTFEDSALRGLLARSSEQIFSPKSFQEILDPPPKRFL